MKEGKEFDIFNSRPRKVVCVRNDENVIRTEENMHLLEVGTEYTVERVEVHSWHTLVLVSEIPNVPFNSVAFDEVEGKV